MKAFRHAAGIIDMRDPTKLRSLADLRLIGVEAGSG
jgi:hypothetical protein